MKAPLLARPLTDQAKEALFNIIRGKIEVNSFLDLFAGSGAVGIEALSRGAARAVFVELDRKAVQVIRENLAQSGLADQAEIYPLDVMQALDRIEKKGERFDIIYLGAPYESPELEKAMEKLGPAGILNAGGLVIAEHRRQHKLPDAYGKLSLCREARYGETILAFYENRDLSGKL